VLQIFSVPGLRPEEVLRLYKDLGKGRRSSGSEVVMPEMSGRTGGDTGSFAAWPEGCFTTGYTRNVIMHSSRSGHASPLQTVRNQSACEKIQEILDESQLHDDGHWRSCLHQPTRACLFEWRLADIEQSSETLAQASGGVRFGG
jgi:hypothetical protein